MEVATPLIREIVGRMVQSISTTTILVLSAWLVMLMAAVAVVHPWGSLAIGMIALLWVWNLSKPQRLDSARVSRMPAALKKSSSRNKYSKTYAK